MITNGHNRLVRLACFLILSALIQFQSLAADLKIVPGKFSGSIKSLTNYVCPDWFRDAKFGIWAHWGPQAVPMEGDWYARKMYQEGSDDYKDHLARFGHPSINASEAGNYFCMSQFLTSLGALSRQRNENSLIFLGLYT
jgi:hypothetical protein